MVEVMVMPLRLLALTLVLLGTLGPAVCRAACADVGAAPALPCHAASPQSEEAPPVHDETCCDEARLVRPAAANTVLDSPFALALPSANAFDPAQPARPVLARVLPRPPDLENSPYVRVTPPRLAYPS